MSVWEIIGICLAAFVVLYTWALCRMAAISDRRAEADRFDAFVQASIEKQQQYLSEGRKIYVRTEDEIIAAAERTFAEPGIHPPYLLPMPMPHKRAHERA